MAGGADTGGAPHCVCHRLVATQGLYPEGYCLELCAHLCEFLDISTCPNEILGHDFACILKEMSVGQAAGHDGCYHLASLCALLDVLDELLLAVFQFGALAVEFALRLGERALVLAQTLGGRDCAAKESFLDIVERDVSGQKSDLR